MKYIKYIMTVLAAVMIASCSLLEKADLPQNITNKRNILIYMAANNNLSSNAMMNLASLETGYVPDYNDDNVLLVYRDIANSNPQLVRYSRDKFGEVTEEIIETYDRQNSADPEVMKYILERSVTLFPCESYGLILWSHATGWLPQGYYSNGPTDAAPQAIDPYAHLVKSFGSDQTDSREIEIHELDDILPVKYEFIVFDCCLMGGIETAYQLRDKANYIIASPTEILAQGFPYDKIFKYLFSNGESGLKSICYEFFNQYDTQEGLMKSATVSLYKLAGIEKIAMDVSRIMEYNQHKIEKITMDQMQPYYRFNKHWFFDLGCYIKSLATEEQFSQFEADLSDVVILELHTPSFLNTIELDDSKVYGISTYIPKFGNEELNNFYHKLDWNRDSGMIQ